MQIENTDKPQSPLQSRLHEIIFESDTRAGRAFDIFLIFLILLSVSIVLLESIASIRSEYGDYLYTGEWILTLIFTLEFFLRIYSVRAPWRYIFSFYGMVDLLAVIPTYLSLLIPGAQSLLVVRTFRMIRIFRILKLSSYLGQAQVLSTALAASRPKITVFLVGVISVVITMGAVMYMVEGEANGFTSIPVSIYWAIVTLTTVGFGDITPKTPIGQLLASCLMILGYGVIAIPTGIVTSELIKPSGPAPVSGQACPVCGHPSHEFEARYCSRCGSKL